MKFKLLIFFYFLQAFCASAQEFVNVLNLGVKNDSSLVTTTAGNNLQAALNEGDKTIYFPKGIYYFNRRGTDGLGFEYIFTITSENLKIWIAPGAKIYFPTSNTQGSTFGHFFMLKAGTDNFNIVGGNFYSTSQDSTFETGYYSAVYAIEAYNVKVENVNFYDVTPVVYQSGNSEEFIFTCCTIKNAPSSLVPCYNSIITQNDFLHDYFYDAGTHDIYSYGQFGRVKISDNTFTRPGGYAIKIRASTAQYEIKSDFIITNNIGYDVPDGFIDLGTNEEVNHINLIFTGNTCTNCQRVQLYNPQSATISNNMWRIDLFSRDNISYGFISFASNITDINGGTSLPRDFIISNNVAENTGRWVSKMTFSANPDIGDTLKIGDVTYTIVASPATDTEIERGGILSITISNIYLKLKDTWESGGLVRLYADQFEQIIRNNSTSQIFLNLNDSLTIETDLPVTFSEKNIDYRDRFTLGLQINGIFEGVQIYGNDIIGAVLPVSLNKNRYLEFYNNIIIGHYGTQALAASGNILPKYINNRYITTSVSAVYRIDVLDWMPFWFNNFGFPTISFVSDYPEIGLSSVVTTTPGDGIAHNYMWVGAQQSVTPTYQTKFYHWTEGDSVNLYRNDTLLYAFIYVQNSPTAGQFSSKAGLVDSINATSEFNAVNLKPSEGQGIIRIESSSAGISGNNLSIRAVTASYFNGLTLQADFAGGSASANETIFWTPYANQYTAPGVLPLNSSALTLDAYIESASTVNGVYYKVNHNVASGSELILIKM